MTHFIVKRRDLEKGELSEQHELDCSDLHVLWKNIVLSLPLTDADWIVDVELRIIVSRVIPEAAKAGGK